MCNDPAPAVRKDLRAADLFPALGVQLPLQCQNAHFKRIRVAESFRQHRTPGPRHIQDVFVRRRVKPRFNSKGSARPLIEPDHQRLSVAHPSDRIRSTTRVLVLRGDERAECGDEPARPWLTNAPTALATTLEDAPLGLAWPEQVFSLSHVALPFAVDDPVYGSEPPDGPAPSIALGRLSPRGEKAVLTVPVETLMRIGWSPFLPFLLGRIVEFTGPNRTASPSR